MAATKGHLGILYKWNGTASDLAAEPCTVSSNDAQITDSDKRILNPNCTDLAFTPTNSVSLLGIDYASGTAHFDGAPGVTTCAGTGAYIAAANLVKTAQLFEWTLEVTLDTEEITDFQDAWAAHSANLARASGAVQGFLAGSNWWDDLEDETDTTMDYWLLELFSYDPDDDATGDHWICWAIFTGFSLNVRPGEIIKENIPFVVHGYPYFVANT